MFKFFLVLSIITTPLSLVLLYKGLDNSTNEVVFIISGMILSVVSTVISFFLGRKKERYGMILFSVNKLFLVFNIVVNLGYGLFLFLFFKNLLF